MKRKQLLLLLALLITAATGAWAQDAENLNVYSNALNTQELFDGMTKIDANEDGTDTNGKWLRHDNLVTYNYSSQNKDADDWLVTSGITLQAGVTYTIAIDAIKPAPQQSTYTETFEMKVGTDATAANLSAGTTAIATTEVTTAWTNYHGTFTPTTTGNYYVGIHASSPANQNMFSIRNLFVGVKYYSVNLNDGTENPTTWKAKVGDATEFGKLPLENVVEGQTVTLEYSGSREVKSITATVIYPATATAPEANTATIIAGSTTQLVTGGTAEGGTMMYCVTTTNDRPTSTDDFSAAIPTAQACADAGTYYVWYYVKADGDHLDSAISSEAIQVTVKTIPAGAINGIFTIAEGSKVYFSKGNLQATYSNNNWTWAFAEQQWDYIGNNTANTSINGNGTVSTSGTVDLFGWVGEKSVWEGAAQYGISNSTNTGSIYGYSKTLGEPLKADWGNTIDGNWRTLTLTEWLYLFNTRTSGSTVNVTSDARFTFATINTVGGEGGVNGIILFPDGVTIASDEATSWGNINGKSDWETKCTSEEWSALADKGCVFLPAAGRRYQASVSEYGSKGYYWSTTSEYNEFGSNGGNAFYLNFPYNSDLAISPCYSNQRYYGCSVRLVIAAE